MKYVIILLGALLVGGQAFASSYPSCESFAQFDIAAPHLKNPVDLDDKVQPATDNVCSFYDHSPVACKLHYILTTCPEGSSSCEAGEQVGLLCALNPKGCSDDSGLYCAP